MASSAGTIHSVSRTMIRAPSALAAALVVTAASLACPVAARGQLEQARATIAGRVLGTDSAALVGADVEIVGSRERSLTDTSGRFRFNNIYPGRYELRIRKLGYEHLVRFVTVGPGEINERAYPMRWLPQVITEVTIAGKRIEVLPRYRDAYRRAAWGFGDYVLPEEIARRNPLDTKALLEGIPGVHVKYGRTDYALTIERCAAPPGTDAMSSQFRNSAKIQVYIDGQQATRPGGLTVLEALESVHPLDIELIEVYRGVARIPSEFLADACAVIAVWTKSH